MDFYGTTCALAQPICRKFDEQVDGLINTTKTMSLEEFSLERATEQGEKKGKEGNRLS